MGGGPPANWICPGLINRGCPLPETQMPGGFFFVSVGASRGNRLPLLKPRRPPQIPSTGVGVGVGGRGVSPFGDAGVWVLILIGVCLTWATPGRRCTAKLESPESQPGRGRGRGCLSCRDSARPWDEARHQRCLPDAAWGAVPFSF